MSVRARNLHRSPVRCDSATSAHNQTKEIIAKFYVEQLLSCEFLTGGTCFNSFLDLAMLTDMDFFSPLSYLKQTTITSLSITQKHSAVPDSSLHLFNNQFSVGKRPFQLLNPPCYLCYMPTSPCKFTRLVT